MTCGLVIGKFYPPHRAHKFLIDAALVQVDHLDVLICVRPEQTIPRQLRAQWLREMHPSACDPGSRFLVPGRKDCPQPFPRSTSCSRKAWGAVEPATSSGGSSVA